MAINSSRQAHTNQSERRFPDIPPVGEIVSQILESEPSGMSHAMAVRLVQFELQDVRTEMSSGSAITREEVIARCLAVSRRLEQPKLTRSINGTGIVIHTNLGRAPVSEETARAMVEAATGNVPLEIEPETNQRGGRMVEVSRLMRLLTGAESTLVVNNNAAAVLVTLAALADDREVIVSRGEAIEIGGGFRIPDVMRQSGAKLVEVGTTNRTYAADYAAAITSQSVALLKVHPSNFRIEGFTTWSSVSDLAPIARERSIALIEDLGSGALLETERFGLGHEPTIQESLSNGADVVTASGDKLLGGPQAGIICGRAGLIDQIAAHPLARAVRVDKATLAGVARTLRHYVAGDAEVRIPVWRMIGTSADELKVRAAELTTSRQLPRRNIEAVPTTAAIGGGSLPGQTLPSFGVSMKSNGLHTIELSQRLRLGKPRVFSTTREGRVIVDLRTVLPEDDAALSKAISNVLSGK